MAKLKGSFLMTYESTAYVRMLAAQHSFECREIPMRTAHHQPKSELLISRNLDWLPANYKSGSAANAALAQAETFFF